MSDADFENSIPRLQWRLKVANACVIRILEVFQDYVTHEKDVSVIPELKKYKERLKRGNELVAIANSRDDYRLAVDCYVGIKDDLDAFYDSIITDDFLDRHLERKYPDRFPPSQEK